MVPLRGERAGGPLGAASGPPPGPALVKSPSGPGEPHTGHGPAWFFELIDPVGEGASAAWKKFVLLMLDVSNRKKKKKNQGWKVFVQRARNFSRPALFAESSILGNVSKFCI